MKLKVWIKSEMPLSVFFEKLKADTWRDFVHVPPLSFTFSIFGLFMALLTRQLLDLSGSHVPPSELPAFDTCLLGLQ